MFADVGIPMIFVQWPLMFGALIPVIVVEALLIRRWVPLSRGEAFSGITLANLLSTVVGVPLAWIAMLALEFAVLWPAAIAADKWHWKLESPVLQVVGFAAGVAWMPPLQVKWAVPAAAALLLIPCFYASVWIERWACLRLWPAAESRMVRRGVFLANLTSYSLLFVFGCGWAIFELLSKKNH